MKKVLIALFSILILAAVSLDAWYIYILVAMPEKVVSQTFEVGEMKTKTLDPDDEETKYFAEVNLYDNVFEIKYNYFLDEKRENFYSQGIQFVSKNGKLNFDGTYTTETFDWVSDSKDPTKKVKNLLLYEKVNNGANTNFHYWHHNRILSDKKYSYLTTWQYQSGMNDFKIPAESTNFLDSDSFFKIEIDGKIYGMKFKGNKLDFDKLKDDNELYLGTTNVFAFTNNYIFVVDHNYDVYHNFQDANPFSFAEIIYNSIKGIAPGTNGTLVFEFGDLFDYYEYDESSKQYNEKTVSSDAAAKITSDIKSYYKIKVNVNEGSMTSSKQSMFNMLRGTQNYNENESSTFDDYFIGRTIIDATEDDCFKVRSDEQGHFKLKLSDDFIQAYLPYKNQIRLRIVIDLDRLESAGIKFDGFIKFGSEDFKIYKVITRKTIDNHVVEEVLDV